MKVCQVRVFQGLSCCDPLFWIKHEEFVEQIDGLGRSKREKFTEILAVILVFGQIHDELLAFLREVLHILKIGRPKYSQMSFI